MAKIYFNIPEGLSTKKNSEVPSKKMKKKLLYILIPSLILNLVLGFIIVKQLIMG